MKALALLAAAAILSIFAIACSSDDDLVDSPNEPLGGTADAGTPPGTGVDDPSRGGPFSDPNDDEDTATVVTVTQTDEEIVLDSRRIEEGKVTFEITNEGAKTHDFAVIKTDAGA
ncbi:MAG TPA: hypothetical protein VG845_05650, partial [Dehalococcoidia bacterium]|nr:hypothetical protein [Dehalococcoidia bacterium]